jgi:putative cardiolipin synthase
MTRIQIIKKILTIYCLYAVVLGGLIFGFSKNKVSTYFEKNNVDRFWGQEEGQDRVVLIEDRYFSGIARINLIEKAQQTLDIAYFTIDDGISSNIFYGKILDAADKGVKVRILIDGIFHNLRGSSRDIRYTLTSHPNIQLKFYEPLSLLRPWTWNNRLHDKYIIMDNELAMIGGRNIGDRYFLDEKYGGEIVNDRDVIIINTDAKELSNSVVSKMTDYFESVWNHKYSKNPIGSSIKYLKKRGKAKEQDIRDCINKLKDTHPGIFNRYIDWLSISVPTKKVTLIHNPIERLNKEPWVWGEITRLMDQAKESIFIQSPYIIPTKNMLKYIKSDIDLSKEIVVLTNSIASSPNYPGAAGYIGNRRNIRYISNSLYEYHGTGSIHGKSYIIDNRISLVGSFNIDARSAFLSTETMVVIDSEEFAQVLKGKVNDLINDSLLVEGRSLYRENPFVEEKKVPIGKVILVGVLWAVTYFFDYLL